MNYSITTKMAVWICNQIVMICFGWHDFKYKPYGYILFSEYYNSYGVLKNICTCVLMCLENSVAHHLKKVNELS